MKMFYLVFETVQCYMKVRDTVTSCEATKHAGVVDRIGSGNVHNLEIHLECSTPLVTSNL